MGYFDSANVSNKERTKMDQNIWISDLEIFAYEIKNTTSPITLRVT